MAQTIQILRTTTNTPPPTLLPGALSAELGPQTKLWIGAAAGNRLLLSTDPTDITLSGGAIIASAAPNAMPGSLWWDSNIGQLYIRYFDGNSTAWVSASTGTSIAIPIAIASGGTSAITAPAALVNLGAVAKAGDTMTGDLTIAVPGAVNSQLILNKSATGQHCIIYGSRAGSVRWSMTLGQGLDTGSGDGGSDFALYRWSDAQVATSVLSINRATGNAQFGASIYAGGTMPPAPGSIQMGTVYGSQLATDQLIGINVVFDGVGNWRYLHNASGGFGMNGDGAGNFSMVAFPAAGAAGTVASGGVVTLAIDGLFRTILYGVELIMGQKFSTPYTMLLAYEFGQFSAFYSPQGSAAAGGIIYGNAANPQATYANASHSFQSRDRSATYCTFTSTNTANVSGAWAVISGEAVKENIEPYTRGLDAILALEPVQFAYRQGTPFAEAGAPSRRLMGLLAEQVRPHIPEICGNVSLPARELDLEAAVDAVAERQDFDTLEPGNLIYACINAIKELNAKVEALAPAAPVARR